MWGPATTRRSFGDLVFPFTFVQRPLRLVVEPFGHAFAAQLLGVS